MQKGILQMSDHINNLKFLVLAKPIRPILMQFCVSVNGPTPVLLYAIPTFAGIASLYIN